MARRLFQYYFLHVDCHTCRVNPIIVRVIFSIIFSLLKIPRKAGVQSGKNIKLSCASCTRAMDFARDANVAIKVTERKISNTFSSRRRRTRTLSPTIAGPVRRRSSSSRIMNPQQPDQDALQALQALAPLNPAQVPPAPDANPAPVANNPAQPDQVAANQPNEVDMLSLFDFVFVFFVFFFIQCYAL